MNDPAAIAVSLTELARWPTFIGSILCGNRAILFVAFDWRPDAGLRVQMDIEQAAFNGRFVRATLSETQEN